MEITETAAVEMALLRAVTPMVPATEMLRAALETAITIMETLAVKTAAKATTVMA